MYKVKNTHNSPVSVHLKDGTQAILGAFTEGEFDLTDSELRRFTRYGFKIEKVKPKQQPRNKPENTDKE